MVARLLRITNGSSVEIDPTELKQEISVRETTHDHSEKLVQFSGDQQPKPTDQIVYVCGTFDLFHIGHLCFLEEAAKLGDYLIVGIYGDDVFEQLDGKRKPIMALHERALSVLSYKPVSEVIIGAPYNLTEDFINRLKIDLVVCGTENAKRDHLTEKDQFDVPKKLGKFKLIDSGSSVTTDEIIKRIANNCCEFHLRNKKKVAKDRAANDWLQLQEENSK